MQKTLMTYLVENSPTCLIWSNKSYIQRAANLFCPCFNSLLAVSSLQGLLSMSNQICCSKKPTLCISIAQTHCIDILCAIAFSSTVLIHWETKSKSRRITSAHISTNLFSNMASMREAFTLQCEVSPTGYRYPSQGSLLRKLFHKTDNLG